MNAIGRCLLLLFSVWTFAGPVWADTFWVSNDGENGAPGTQDLPWETLQYAADQVQHGDTVIIMAGSYAGFRAKSSGDPGNPITFKATDGAAVIINRVGPDVWHDSIINIENQDHWVLEGLEVTGAPQNAGIDIRLADHVTVRHCYLHHNQKWGIFTGFVEYFTAEYNECSYSSEEHGIYHSNSGDHAVIRYNHCHHNNACGIQINADPSMGGDGISSYCTVSHNILNNNGAAGGAAINLASVRNSLIANNLVFDNQAGGIAAWDDGQGHEWGSKDNRFYYNTVHMPATGRWALNLGNGSTGSQIVDNILIHDGSYRGGLEIDESSLADTHSDYNLIARISVDENVMTLDDWENDYGQDAHSFIADAGDTFVAPGIDYHLKAISVAVDQGDPLMDVTTDIDDRPRLLDPGVDMGAYETFHCIVDFDTDGDTDGQDLFSSTSQPDFACVSFLAAYFGRE